MTEEIIEETVEETVKEETMLEKICRMFDEHYELSEKEQKALVTDLKTIIEKQWRAAKKNFDATGMSMIELDWIVWMYGKLRYITRGVNEEIIGQYKSKQDVYDQRSRDISEEKHFTNMYDVIKYDMESKTDATE